nr:MAG TPA: hypothetical protein [Caudoviricetes sp.]
MENIVNIAFVDLVGIRGRWVASAFMHATDCNFTIRSNFTDPSTAIRELMHIVQRIQGVTLALRSWQEGGVTFTRCTYWREKGRYVLTYSDSSDDDAYVCAIVISERGEDSIEIFPGERPALALEAEAILCDKGYTVHMVEEDENGGLPQWLH